MVAVDLGTAYISLVPTTKDFDKGIKSALDATVKHADKAGDKMGNTIAASLSQHLDKGGTKAGDAFVRSFTPKVQGAGKTAMQGLAQAMLGGAEGMGSQVGGKFSGGLVSAVSKGADGAMAALQKLGSSGGWSSGMVTAGMVAAGGVAAITSAAVVAGKALYDIGSTWDSVADGITFKTGLVGDQLNAVKESVKNVAAETAASIGDIANISASLTKGLKIPPGAGLEKLTQQIAQFNAAAMDNGAEPINMREFIKAMKQMKLDGNVEGMMAMLDNLYKVTQNTTIPMNSLIENLKTLGPTAASLKIPAETLVQIISGMEESGLNAETAMIALRTAWKKLQDDPNPANGFRSKIDEITRLLQSTSEEAQIAGEKMATEFFGNRAGPALADAIRKGNVELNNFDTNASKTGLSIGEMTDQTSDFAQEWQRFTNFLSGTFEPAATAIFSGFNDLLTGIVDNLRFIMNNNLLGVLLQSPTYGGNPGAQPGLAPGPEAAGGILGGAAGIAPGIGGVLGGGGNAASSILGGMAGAAAGIPIMGGGVLGTAGRGYFNSRAAAAALDRRLVDSALLSQVPSGTYKFGAGELTQGLADCSSAIEDLINILDGNPTAGRSMSTGNAAEWLMARGFRPGTAPGAFNVGFNASHMQATLPGGTNFNWGSPAAAAQRGIGGTGAFDPALTQRYYRYDTGGILPPGTTIVQNDTGKPELVLNSDQQNNLADSGVDPNTLLHGGGGGAAPGPINGVDPNTILHGAANGAAPGPQQPTGTTPDSPNYGDEFFRSLGFTPSAGSNTGYAGTSSLAKVIKMPAQFLGGLMDTAANLGSMAVSAAIAAGAGASGGSAAAGYAASPALSYGFSLASAEGKEIANYWLGDLPAIAADSIIAQMFPFGAPRWLGYDYTQFAPQLGISQAATTTLEKMGSDAINKYFGVDKNGNPIPQPHGQSAGAPPGPPPGGAAMNPNQMMAGNLPGPEPGAPPSPGPAPANVAPPPPDIAPMPPTGAVAGITPQNLMPQLFDDGGMLQPGGVGVNMTNRPEPVLTPQQWDAMNNQIQPQGRDAPLVKIDAIYGMNPEDVARQIESKQKLAMMRYSGRP